MKSSHSPSVATPRAGRRTARGERNCGGTARPAAGEGDRPCGTSESAASSRARRGLRSFELPEIGVLEEAGAGGEQRRQQSEAPVPPTAVQDVVPHEAPGRPLAGRALRTADVAAHRLRRLPQVRLSLGARTSGARAAHAMRLPILMYHKVDRLPPPPGARYVRNYVLPEQFDPQLGALRRWAYQTISFDDWLAYRRGERTLPRRPIILTFDDGYRSTGEIAWPLLQRHGATATVFLVSDLIGKTNAWDAREIQEPLLGPGEIAAMRAGHIEFGSHTKTHAALTTLPPPT